MTPETAKPEESHRWTVQLHCPENVGQIIHRAAGKEQASTGKEQPSTWPWGKSNLPHGRGERATFHRAAGKEQASTWPQGKSNLPQGKSNLPHGRGERATFHMAVGKEQPSTGPRGKNKLPQGRGERASLPVQCSACARWQCRHWQWTSATVLPSLGLHARGRQQGHAPWKHAARSIDNWFFMPSQPRRSYQGDSNVVKKKQEVKLKSVSASHYTKNAKSKNQIYTARNSNSLGLRETARSRTLKSRSKE